MQESQTDFMTCIAVDFPDDVGEAAFDRSMFEQMMRIFKDWGIQRVYWQDYANGEMFYSMPNRGGNMRRTAENVGDILGTAVETAHAEGLELIAILKPFDCGMPMGRSHRGPEPLPRNPQLSPLNQTELQCMDFIRRRPDLRMRHRQAAELEQAQQQRVGRIEFFDETHKPGPIDPALFHIYTSPDNSGYRRYEKPFDFRYDQVFDERTGKEVLRLTLDGLDIHEPYLLFTCETMWNSIGNRFSLLARAYTPEGEAIPSTPGMVLVPGSHLGDSSVLFNYVAGVPSGCSRWTQREVLARRIPLDGPDGCFALALGVDPYMTGALCPAEPEAREIWLEWTRRCLAAGADGIEYRISNHNSPFDCHAYGYNDAVVAEYRRRHGIDILTEPHDANRKAAILGDGYTTFLREAATLVRGAGKTMYHHICADMFPEPGERHWLDIEWQWRTWMESGLLDGITLKGAVPGPLAGKTRSLGGETARKAGIPFYYSPWHSDAIGKPARFEFIRDQYRRARADADAAGFIVYESAAVLDIRPGSVRPHFETFKQYLEPGT
jgi:hypothetical protein